MENSAPGPELYIIHKMAGSRMIWDERALPRQKEELGSVPVARGDP
jgi:hypothetical protein